MWLATCLVMSGTCVGGPAPPAGWAARPPPWPGPGRAASSRPASSSSLLAAHRSLSRSHGGLWKYINVMNGDENIMRQCSVTMAGCATRQMTWSPDHCLWSHTIDTECRDWPRTGHRAQLVLKIDTSLCRYLLQFDNSIISGAPHHHLTSNH